MRSKQSFSSAFLAIFTVAVLAGAAAPLSAQTVPDPLGVLCSALPVNPVGGCVAWQDRYDGESPGDDGPTDVVVSPDGSQLFTVGFSFQRPPLGTGYDYVTVAYDARSGARSWVMEYDGPGRPGEPIAGDDFAMATTISPDGDTLYVTGTSHGFVPNAGVDATGVATIAYDAATGAVKWTARYQGAGLTTDIGRDVVASPDGNLVYVLATLGGAHNQDVGLLTYDATTGALVHDDVYTGPADRHDSVFFRSLAVAPDGQQVFAAAQSYTDTSTGYDYALLRYDASGALTGVSRYDAGEGNVERAFGLDIAPDGAQVYLTGRSRTAATGYDFATVAFDAAGNQLWVARYDASGATDEAFVVRASPDGSVVAVTGGSDGGGSGYDYATVVYDAATGAERWQARHEGIGGGHDLAKSLAFSPDSLRIYVTGSARGAAQDLDAVTLAYDVVTGLVMWSHTYLSSGQGDDAAIDVTVAPDGGLVYVTADTYTNPLTSFDIATFALKPDLGGLPLPSV